MKHSWLSGCISRVMPRVIGVNPSQVLSILVYHRVLEKTDFLRPGVPTVEEFSWQMELISKHFTPLSLDEALLRLSEGTLPKRAICVTFDDGYADNLSLALPVLKAWSVPATVYVSTAFLDGGRMWNDTIIEFVRHYSQNKLRLDQISQVPFRMETQGDRLRATHELIAFAKYMDQSSRVDFAESLARLSNKSGNPLPTDLMLSSSGVVSLSQQGITIGGHTINHPILSEVTDEQARYEISEGRAQLEGLIQSRVENFAYPNGVRGKDFDVRHERIVRAAGFRSAVTTHWGASNKATRFTSIPRFTPWDKDPYKFALRLVLNMKRTQIPELECGR